MTLPNDEDSQRPKFNFLAIKKKDYFYIISIESITFTTNNYKPPKGSLSSSHLFVTSPHTYSYHLNI